jgi:hypothetical protein
MIVSRSPLLFPEVLPVSTVIRRVRGWIGFNGFLDLKRCALLGPFSENREIAIFAKINAPTEGDESCRNASKKGGSLWSVGPLVVDRPVVVIWVAGLPQMVDWPAVKRLRWCVEA